MLKHRLISGVSMGAAFVLAILFVPTVLLVLALIGVSFLGQREFYRMAEKAGVPVFRNMGYACGTLLLWVMYLSLSGSMVVPENGAIEPLLVVLCTVAVMLCAFQPSVSEKRIESIAGTLLGILYVPYFLSFLLKLIAPYNPRGIWEWEPIGTIGQTWIFFLVLVVKIADVGAYFVGSRLGKHKLAPRISPGKTWEGLAGGAAAAALASMAFVSIVGPNIPMGDAVAMGVFVAMAGVVGDLFESLIKRSAGEKDSGDSIPGMGGMLDVLDSLLFGAPFLYLYLNAFLWERVFYY